jgi:hypothetical protein
MTIQDVPAFRKGLESLARVLGNECSEDRAEGYWEALKDLPLEILTRTFFEGQKEWKRFPVPALIREVAERIKPSVYRPEPPRFTDDHQPIFECLNCQDTGLQPIQIDSGRPIVFQDMAGSHANYKMRRCQCRSANGVIQRRWAAMKRIAAPATQRWGG